MHIARQLFDYSGWDGEPDCIVFYNPKLKVQIGEFPPGSEFDCAIIHYDKAKLVLEKESGETYKYDLKLIV